MDKSAMAAKGDLHRSFLVFDLNVDGKQVSRNLIFFGAMHDLELPVAPKIETTFNKTVDGYDVTLKSAQLARSVYLSFGNLEVQTSDNYFDLLPGEAITLHLKSDSAQDQLSGQMKVTSLTEAYNSK
jgi:beta-mannosidase